MTWALRRSPGNSCGEIPTIEQPISQSPAKMMRPRLLDAGVAQLIQTCAQIACKSRRCCLRDLIPPRVSGVVGERNPVFLLSQRPSSDYFSETENNKFSLMVRRCDAKSVVSQKISRVQASFNCFASLMLYLLTAFFHVFPLEGPNDSIKT